jgi:hypothetical protein
LDGKRRFRLSVCYVAALPGNRPLGRGGKEHVADQQKRPLNSNAYKDYTPT